MGLAGKPEGKRPIGRPLCGWKDNIKMDLKSVRKACIVDLAQNRHKWWALLNAVTNPWYS